MGRLSELNRSVAGRSVLVTGAASGMGRATARLFADEGAHVAVTDLEQSGVDAVVGEITDAGLSAKGWTLDVADADRIGVVVDELVAAFGGLDIVINNAGISRPTPIDGDEYEDHWALSLEVLLTAHTRVIRAALPHLRRSDSARIVNIASTEGWGATKFGSPYTAAKHGVIGLTKSLAVELGREAITVNCICPGPINTGMTAQIDDGDKLIFAKRRTALGRYGMPEEVAHGTLNFCLPASRYMTGAILPVDGGLLVKNA
ncbi:MAG: SDR family NAD(P)-dependent oxidoreductase [Actinomycetota bacterium]